MEWKFFSGGIFLATLVSLSLVALAQKTVTYIHTDALGSVVATSDADGNVTQTREYEPYGQQLSGLSDGVGYTGHVQDSSTGLVYMQQRYYDPALGRFLSVDPISADASTGENFNRYWYAANNPYKYFDPDGRYPCIATPPAPVCVKALAAAGNAVYRGYRLARAGSAVLNEVGSTEGESGSGAGENTNPYDGPISEPVVVVDPDGNAIPVGEGEQITSSPDGDYQQVRDSEGRATGTRLDRGGHRNQSDPQARGPHAHRPNVTDESGNPHLPINRPVQEPKP